MPSHCFVPVIHRDLLTHGAQKMKVLSFLQGDSSLSWIFGGGDDGKRRGREKWKTANDAAIEATGFVRHKEDNTEP